MHSGFCRRVEAGSEPMKKIRVWIALIVTLNLACLSTLPVRAHAVLVYSNPGANAILTHSPSQVELFLSEPPAVKLSQLKVLDAAGNQVDLGDVHLDPAYYTHLVVSLPKLPQGVYQVVWRVISATDGHETGGEYSFAVGTASTGFMVPTTPQTGASLPVADMLVKGFLYLSASILLGSILFTFVVWDPSVRLTGLPQEDGWGYERFSRGLALVGIVTFGLANLLSLVVQAGLAKGVLFAWPGQPEFGAVVAATRVGNFGILRFEASLVLAFLLLPKKNFWNRWTALVICLLLLLTFSLESHAAGTPHPFLPVLADWLHMTAVSVWVGGLFSFMGATISSRRLAPEPKTILTSFLIPYFSNLAWVSVGILGLTGLYAAFLEVGQFQALWTTAYGQALLIKLILALPMLALGGIHYFFTRPAIRQAASRSGGAPVLVKRFRSMLTVEAALGIVTLLWVGIFTALPPASLPQVSQGASRLIRPGAPVSGWVTGPLQPVSHRETKSGQPIRFSKDYEISPENHDNCLWDLEKRLF